MYYYNSFDYPASSGFSRPDATGVRPGETTARRLSFDKIKMKIQLYALFFNYLIYVHILKNQALFYNVVFSYLVLSPIYY